MRPGGGFRPSLHRDLPPDVWPGGGGRLRCTAVCPSMSGPEGGAAFVAPWFAPSCFFCKALWADGLGLLGGRSGPHGGPAFVAPWCAPPSSWPPRRLLNSPRGRHQRPIAPKRAQDARKAAPRRPRGLQEHSKTAQEHAKSAQKAPKRSSQSCARNAFREHDSSQPAREGFQTF